MRFLTHLLAAATLAASTLSATAGGVSPEIMETPPTAPEEVMPATGSGNGALIVLGVMALLLLAANNNSDGEPTPQPE